MKYLILIYKNIGRNLLRSFLMGMGTMVLVLVVTLVWSVLAFIDKTTEKKSKDFKAIVTERWSQPSRMPPHYADILRDGAARKDHPEDVRPDDSMTWQFYVGTLDKANPDFSNRIFGLACDPDKILSMLDDLDKDHLPPGQFDDMRASVERLKKTRNGIILGYGRLSDLNSIIGKIRDPIGQKFKLSGISTFTGMDMEFEIVGVFPPGRYDKFTAFNRDYFQATLDAYKNEHQGVKHPIDDTSLGIVWIKVPDEATYDKIVHQVDSSTLLKNPEVNIEMASSAIGTFMAAFRDLLNGMRWLVVPACIITLALVLANAISISVRERRSELAVMKVLGFRPGQILILVLGEAVFLGLVAGLASAAISFVVINYWFGGIKFPIGFFPAFLAPIDALGWGALVGASAALAGSLVPAWFACQVKPAEVFAKVG